MHLAAAISEHPVVAHAVGECVGDILERRGDSPDLLIVSISERLEGASEDIAGAVEALLSPEVMLGVASSSMSVGPHSSRGNPALAMLAVWHTRPSSVSGQVAIEPDWHVRASQRINKVRIGPDLDVVHLAGSTGTLLLFADPFSAPIGPLLERLREAAPELLVIAASPDTARRPSMAGLLLNGSIHSDGAVGVLFPERFPHRLLCSFGFSPVGARFVVDVVDGARIHDLDGRPATEVLGEAIEGLAPAERAAAAKGLYLRWSAPAGPAPTGSGAGRQSERLQIPRFCSVLGTDGDSIVIAGEHPPGANSIQFQIRDAASTDADLRLLAEANSDLLGGLFLIADRPDRAAVPDDPLTAALSVAETGPYAGVQPATHLDHIGQDAAILSEGMSRSDLLGIRFGEVTLLDRGEVVVVNRAVTILGLAD